MKVLTLMAALVSLSALGPMAYAQSVNFDCKYKVIEPNGEPGTFQNMSGNASGGNSRFNQVFRSSDGKIQILFEVVATDSNNPVAYIEIKKYDLTTNKIDLDVKSNLLSFPFPNSNAVMATIVSMGDGYEAAVNCQPK